MKYRKVQAATKIQEFTGFTGLLGSLRLTINAPITNRIAAPRPRAFSTHDKENLHPTGAPAAVGQKAETYIGRVAHAKVGGERRYRVRDWQTDTGPTLCACFPV